MKSSIAKQTGRGQRSPFALALGARIRELRCHARMTQAELGWPLTRAYVSAVEHGRTLPSLGALALFADRLELPLERLLADIAPARLGRLEVRGGAVQNGGQGGMSRPYNATHASQDEATRHR